LSGGCGGDGKIERGGDGIDATVTINITVTITVA